MNIDNAARKPHGTDARHSLHLVHSRNWQKNSAGSKPPRRTHANAQNLRGIREKDAVLSLAAAALVAPILWVSHAILRWMHVI